MMKFLDSLFIRINFERTDNPLSIIRPIPWATFKPVGFPWYTRVWMRLNRKRFA